MNRKRQANGPVQRRKRRQSTKAWSGLLAGLLAIVALVIPTLTKSSTASPGTSASRSSTASRSATTIDDSTSENSSSSSRSSKRRSSTTTTEALSSNRTDPRLRKIGFRSQQRLDDHYRKHGREFGNITKAEYLAMAQDLRDARLSKRIIETTQKDGTISRFDRSTGGFTAFNRDLTIRTFFKPNDGEDYFWRASRADR